MINTTRALALLRCCTSSDILARLSTPGEAIPDTLLGATSFAPDGCIEMRGLIMPKPIPRQLEFIHIDNIAPLCKCGCGNPVTWHSNNYWNIYLKGHYNRKYKTWLFDEDAPLCACGCGNPVIRVKHPPFNWNTYIHNHHRATESFVEKRWIDPPLCACGCGQTTSLKYLRRGWRKYVSVEHQLNDPKYHELLSLRNIKMWEVPGFRENHKGKMWDYWSDLVNRMEASTKAKQRYENDPELRLKISVASLANWTRPEYQNIISERRKESWQNPIYVARVRKGRKGAFSASPNLLEQDFNLATSDDLIFVGNGDLWVDLESGKGKNPDFQLADTNKIVELWGTYWHRNQDPDEMIKLYADIGIECMIIWEHDWKDKRESILEEVNQFIGKEI